MKSIVIYKSNTGYTKAYAQMLSEKLDCKVYELGKSNHLNLADYDRIIFGGGVRPSKISGIKTIVKKVATLDNKDIRLVAVGANGKSPENTALLRSKNLDANKVDYPFYYMQGGFDPERLGFFMKFILGRVANAIKKKKAKDPSSLTSEDKDFLNFFQSSHNDVNPDNMEELLRDIHAHS